VFLESVRRVREELTKEDLFVGVDGFGYNVEELAGLSLELPLLSF
jgi:hypothetical protein